MKKIIILTDEPIEQDYRVLKTIKNYDSPIIVDCANLYNKSNNLFKIFFFNTIIIVKSFFFSFLYWKILYKNYKLKPISFISGLVTSMKAKYRSKKIFSIIKEEYSQYSIELIYSNDLTCGLIGMQLSKYFNAELIYDAHEIEFHRNRKNSFLRIIYDILLEKDVINTAKEVIVVNKPIKKLYMDMYNIPENKIRIIDNNHFTPHMRYALNNFSDENQDIAIVYVGGGVFGRKLESLSRDASQTDIKLYGFFLANIPKVVNEYNWKMGSKEYLPELLELIQNKRLAMWCCTEDICLSYRLSLPNKFFQAIAVGIPVVAYKGTYLAEIVKKYNLGYIYNDKNFQEITKLMKDNMSYTTLLESIVVFQKKLFHGGLEL